jgi:hypothetical protein
VSTWRVGVPAGASPTEPYFLEQPRTGATYQWAADAPKTAPFREPLLTAAVGLDIGGVRVTAHAPVMFRYSDPVRGELRRDVNVVPAVAVGFSSTLFVLPAGSAAQSQTVQVQATSLQDAPVSGALSLDLPTGWTATPAMVPFTVSVRGAHAVAEFAVTAPARRAPRSVPRPTRWTSR